MAADKTITDLTALEEALADADLFEVVNVSVTTDSASGSSRKATAAQVATYLGGAGFLTGSGGGYTQVTAAQLPGNVTDLDFHVLNSLGDGAAVTSVTPAVGSGVTGNWAPASAQNPTVRTGANGCNGKAILQTRNSQQTLDSTGGGTTYKTDLFVVMTLRQDNNGGAGSYQILLEMGDNSAGKTRTVIGGNLDSTHDLLQFQTTGSGNQVTSGDTIPNTGFHIFAVAVKRSTSTVSVYIDGHLSGVFQFPDNSSFPPFADFVSNVIRLSGGKFTGSANANWSFARVTLSDTLPSVEQLYGHFAWLNATYALGLTLPAAVWKATGAAAASAGMLTELNGVAQIAGKFVVGGPHVPLRTGGTLGTNATDDASLSVYGAISAYAINQEFLLHNSWGAQNCLRLWNDNPVGYTAVAFNNPQGVEAAALGVGPATIVPYGGATRARVYLECSDFGTSANTSGVTTNFGEFTVVQSRLNSGSGLISQRLLLDNAGAWHFYDQSNFVTNGNIPGAEVFGIQPGGAVVLPNRSSDPSSPAKGWCYFNTSTNKIKVYNGTTWETVTSS